MSDLTDAADPADAADVAAPAPEEVHGCPVTRSRGQRVAHVPRERLLDVVRALRADGFWMCVDVVGVDYLLKDRTDLPEGVTPERFELVVGLINHRDRERIRLRVQVPETDPVVPSLNAVHPGTAHAEREAFDMFGIRFEGHPDLSRILMPDEWVGHPLRKDYDVGRIPVQFKGAPSAR